MSFERGTPQLSFSRQRLSALINCNVISHNYRPDVIHGMSDDTRLFSCRWPHFGRFFRFFYWCRALNSGLARYRSLVCFKVTLFGAAEKYFHFSVVFTLEWIQFNSVASLLMFQYADRRTHGFDNSEAHWRSMEKVFTELSAIRQIVKERLRTNQRAAITIDDLISINFGCFETSN